MTAESHSPLTTAGAWTVSGLGLLCMVLAFRVPTPATPEGKAMAAAFAVTVAAGGASYLLHGDVFGIPMPDAGAWGLAAAMSVMGVALVRLSLLHDPDDQLPLSFVPLLPAVWVVAVGRAAAGRHRR